MELGLAILLSYLLGAVPFSLLAGRLKGIDLRQHGSGNVGATNAIRILGPALGVPVLLLDIVKGLLSSTVIASAFGQEAPELRLLCGVAAVLGHSFPIWLGFKGGKGVATAAGVFLGLAPAAMGIAALLFGAVLLISRYVSLASISGAVALPLALVATHADRVIIGVAAAVALLIVFRHRTNLGRIRAGTESKIPLGSRRTS